MQEVRERMLKLMQATLNAISLKVCYAHVPAGGTTSTR